jgi:hypothetical protein
MKKLTYLAIFLAILFALPTSAALAATGYPWKNHASPYTFLFGNHIDSHQQSQKLSGGQVQGYLYIHYTGETIDGIPVAEHMDCSSDPSACLVGWVIQGIPATGTVVSKDEMGMASFSVETDAARQLVGFSHFHWLGQPMEDIDLEVGQTYSGYLLKLTAVSTFYFRHHDMLTLVKPGIDSSSHANVVVYP